MNSDGRESKPDPKLNAADPVWRRLAERFVRGLSDLLEASEPKRKRPRNLYIKGMTARSLMTRRHGD